MRIYIKLRDKSPAEFEDELIPLYDRYSMMVGEGLSLSTLKLKDDVPSPIREKLKSWYLLECFEGLDDPEPRESNQSIKELCFQLVSRTSVAGIVADLHGVSELEKFQVPPQS